MTRGVLHNAGSRDTNAREESSAPSRLGRHPRHTPAGARGVYRVRQGLSELDVQSHDRVQHGDRRVVGQAPLLGHARVRDRRGHPHLHDRQIPSAERVGRAEARTRQHGARDHVDDRAGRDSRVHRDPNRSHDLRHAGACDTRRASGRSDRTSVVVGVPLPAVHEPAGKRSRRHARDRERSVPAHRAHGELHAQDQGRAAFVLGPAARRQARPHHEPHELLVVHTGLVALDECLQRQLQRILRCVAREHALPNVRGAANRVRPVGGVSADARRIRRGGTRTGRSDA